MKRNYQQMVEQMPCPINMNGVAYHDFSHGGYYSTPPPPPPPPQAMLFSNPFPSPTEYVGEGYIPSPQSMGYYAANRSLSEPFIHQPTESFGAHSDSSSCNASIGPATPPLGPFKFPAVAITPSHTTPRPKTKRTALACEECRKRKQKCDGVSPCQSCKEQKLECKYREPPTTKKDNSIEKLASLVENYNQAMETLNKRFDTVSTILQTIERRLSHCWQCGANVELETGACNACNPISSHL